MSGGEQDLDPEVASLPSDPPTESEVIEVPSDACSFDEGDNSDDTLDWASLICCQKYCLADIKHSTVAEMHASFATMDKPTVDRYMCDALRGMIQADQKKMCYTFLGKKVCRKAWCTAFRVGDGRLSRMLKHVQEGYADAPADLRRTPPPPEPSWQAKHVDLYFTKYYNNPALAEHLAEDVLANLKELDFELPELSAVEYKQGKLVGKAAGGYKDWCAGAGSAGEASGLEATETTMTTTAQ